MKVAFTLFSIQNESNLSKLWRCGEVNFLIEIDEWLIVRTVHPCHIRWMNIQLWMDCLPHTIIVMSLRDSSGFYRTIQLTRSIIYLSRSCRRINWDNYCYGRWALMESSITLHSCYERLRCIDGKHWVNNYRDSLKDICCINFDECLELKEACFSQSSVYVANTVYF